MDNFTKWRKMGFDQAIALMRARATALEEMVVRYPTWHDRIERWQSQARTIRETADDLAKHWKD